MTFRIWCAILVLLLASCVSSAVPPAPEEEDIGCAPRALRLSLTILDREASHAEIKQSFDGRVSGVHSYEEIEKAARHLGLEIRSAKLDPRAPPLTRLPMIAAVKRTSKSTEPDHFVVLYGRTEDSVQVLDFPNSPRLMPCALLAEAWDGSGLYVAARADQLPGSFLDCPWIPSVLLGVAMTVVLVGAGFWIGKKRYDLRAASD